MPSRLRLALAASLAASALVLGACRPRLDSINPNDRIQAITSRDFCGEDQKLLTRIVLQDPNPWVRRVAINQLHDPAELARVFWESRDGACREIVVLNLPDPEIRAHAALEDPDPDVRVAAIKKVQDRAVLERAARDEPVAALRREAAERLARLLRDQKQAPPPQ